MPRLGNIFFLQVYLKSQQCAGASLTDTGTSMAGSMTYSQECPVAPDGRHAVVDSAPTPQIDDAYTSKRAHVIDLTNGKVLRVVETPIGRIGGLICGENGNPLSRYMLMAQNEELHAANYPPVWPFKNPVGAPPFDLRRFEVARLLRPARGGVRGHHAGAGPPASSAALVDAAATRDLRVQPEERDTQYPEGG